jgi:hypothetical protein
MAILRTRWRPALYLLPLVLPALMAACGGKQQAPPPSTAPPPPIAAPTTTTTTTTTTIPTPPPVWREARWGMTRAQVLAAFPGEAQKLPQPVDFGPTVLGSSDLAIAGYETEGQRFRVLFGFEGDGLNRVFLQALKAGETTCRDLEKQLTDKHAAPADRSSTVTNLRNEAIVWKLPDQTITLACAESLGLGYRAVTLDYAAPGKT